MRCFVVVKVFFSVLIIVILDSIFVLIVFIIRILIRLVSFEDRVCVGVVFSRILFLVD